MSAALALYLKIVAVGCGIATLLLVVCGTCVLLLALYSRLCAPPRPRS